MTETSAWAVVIAAFIAAIPATIAAIASLKGARQAKENHQVSKRIEHQTNGQMDEKIRRAVTQVFNENQDAVTTAVMAESVRHLLNAIIDSDNERER